MNDLPEHLERYHRQMLLPAIGEAGQRKLLASHALIVGCGALGCCCADILARAGVGTISIVDRDIVELTNLQRQILFDEDDAREGTPKALAAKTKIGKINSTVVVHAHVDDFNQRNAERYAEGADIILDGLDNFETRYLLNDLAVAQGLPYLYGGAVGSQGMSFPILPYPRHRREGVRGGIRWSEDQATPCLRCVFPEPPPPGSSQTCDTAGVLGPLVNQIASHQAAEAIKLMSGNLDAIDRSMLTIDIWENETKRLNLAGAFKSGQCPCCGRGEFDYLEGTSGSITTSLCGRNAVQITPDEASDGLIDLAALADRLAPHGTFTSNPHLLRGILRAEIGNDGNPMELTLFVNGRAIIKGTNEPDAARIIYAKYVGS